ncbi:DUF1799 domain-containing protein [Mizugakiibacter sediminis]|uniref:DUF1799 domain-containing protein n=1 Tax=Mizugakiibacter sediminis TaxID=1475481 RepID=UPI0009E31415|nr:DUF1799 domain-containing protein [Mizugakiibacter sediminis]
MAGAEALYWKPPNPEELEPYGLTADDYPPPSVELWPENWPAIQLFTRLSTQWRVGAGGPVGLDYGVLFHELDRMGLDTEAYDDLFASIRVIEGIALNELHKKD